MYEGLSVCCHFVGILLSLITDSKVEFLVVTHTSLKGQGGGDKRGLRIGRPEHQVTGRATMLFGSVQFAEQDIRRIPAVRKILFGFHLNRICFILKNLALLGFSLRQYMKKMLR